MHIYMDATDNIIYTTIYNIYIYMYGYVVHDYMRYTEVIYISMFPIRHIEHSSINVDTRINKAMGYIH